MAELIDAVDFALAAYRDDDGWVVQELAHDLEADVDALAQALRRFPGEAAIALLGLDDDFFVVVRVAGSRTRVLLSDASAAEEWDVAASALDFLGLTPPDDDQDLVGDVDLLADLGLSGDDLEDLLDDVDSYPDELLSDLARAVGFGEAFDDALGLTPA